MFFFFGGGGVGGVEGREKTEMNIEANDEHKQDIF